MTNNNIINNNNNNSNNNINNNNNLQMLVNCGPAALERAKLVQNQKGHLPILYNSRF